jgi:hypothetical protein
MAHHRVGVEHGQDDLGVPRLRAGPGRLEARRRTPASGRSPPRPFRKHEHSSPIALAPPLRGLVPFPLGGVPQTSTLTVIVVKVGGTGKA